MSERGSASHSKSGQKYDIQLLCFDLVRNIVIFSRNAMMFPTLTELYAWGGIIESFDAFIFIYYEDDEEYKEKREELKSQLTAINPYDNELKNKLVVKRLYDEWFGLICKKLAKFKIFPPLPTSYAQGIGEVRAMERE